MYACMDLPEQHTKYSTSWSFQKWLLLLLLLLLDQKASQEINTNRVDEQEEKETKTAKFHPPPLHRDYSNAVRWDVCVRV